MVYIVYAHCIHCVVLLQILKTTRIEISRTLSQNKNVSFGLGAAAQRSEKPADCATKTCRSQQIEEKIHSRICYPAKTYEIPSQWISEPIGQKHINMAYCINYQAMAIGESNQSRQLLKIIHFDCFRTYYTSAEIKPKTIEYETCHCHYENNQGHIV